MKPFVRYPVRPTSSGLHPIPVRTIAASRPEENKEFTTSSVPGRMRPRPTRIVPNHDGSPELSVFPCLGNLTYAEIKQARRIHYFYPVFGRLTRWSV